jgi:hypothetical protein
MAAGLKTLAATAATGWRKQKAAQAHKKSTEPTQHIVTGTLKIAKRKSWDRKYNDRGLIRLSEQ